MDGEHIYVIKRVKNITSLTQPVFAYDCIILCQAKSSTELSGVLYIADVFTGIWNYPIPAI